MQIQFLRIFPHPFKYNALNFFRESAIVYIDRPPQHFGQRITPVGFLFWQKHVVQHKCNTGFVLGVITDMCPLSIVTL